jgi:general secretion pathway protein M
MAAVTIWWRGLTRREQILITVMLVLLAVVGLWLGVLRPLAALDAGIAARQAAAETALTEVNSMGRQIRAARQAPAASAPLLERVRLSGDAAGLTLDQLEKAGDGSISLRIAAVRSPALLRWLAELEAREGAVVERLSATRNEDASLAVDLALRSRAA